jgi:hypothetical protein
MDCISKQSEPGQSTMGALLTLVGFNCGQARILKTFCGSIFDESIDSSGLGGD